MLSLTKHQENLFATHVPELTLTPNSVTVHIPNQEAMVFPSSLYPLGNPDSIRLFHAITNTELLDDTEAIAIYDSLTFETGRCYTNTERIVAAFTRAGLGDAITSMTGWLFIGSTPIHHCWAVYKGIHVLDPGTDITPFYVNQRLERLPEHPTGDALRALYLEEKERVAKMPHHEARTFGPVLPGTVYVGTETTPEEGRAIYRDVIAAHPHHPSYSGNGMNATGASRMQELEEEKKANKQKQLRKLKKKKKRK